MAPPAPRCFVLFSFCKVLESYSSNDLGSGTKWNDKTVLMLRAGFPSPGWRRWGRSPLLQWQRPDLVGSRFRERESFTFVLHSSTTVAKKKCGVFTP